MGGLPIREYDRTRLLPYWAEAAKMAEAEEARNQAMLRAQMEQTTSVAGERQSKRAAELKAKEERQNMFGWAENAAKRARPGWGSAFNTTSAPVTSAELAPWISLYQGKTDGVPMVGGGIRVMGGGGGGHDEREMSSEEKRMVAARADLMEEQARAAAIQRQLGPERRDEEQARYNDAMFDRAQQRGVMMDRNQAMVDAAAARASGGGGPSVKEMSDFRLSRFKATTDAISKLMAAKGKKSSGGLSGALNDKPAAEDPTEKAYLSAVEEMGKFDPYAQAPAAQAAPPVADQPSASATIIAPQYEGKAQSGGGVENMGEEELLAQLSEEAVPKVREMLKNKQITLDDLRKRIAERNNKKG